MPLHNLESDRARQLLIAIRDDAEFREAFRDPGLLADKLSELEIDVSPDEIPPHAVPPSPGAAEEALRMLDEVAAVEPYRPPFSACPFPPPYSAASYAFLLQLYHRASGGESQQA